MATTTVDTFPKSTVSRPDVEQERQGQLDAGATSSTITEDATNWILTGIWPDV